jgi:MFS transporter, FHS family, glucose/mannose:H+ symporter
MVAARANSHLWRWTMAFTGVGSTMLGPFLPHLLTYWSISDREGGMLVASLFLGSFSGTLAMSDHLEQCLRRGAWTATLGCAGFAGATGIARGFVPGMLALLVMGFGMGQLMSSLNLLVGGGPETTRARELAGLSAAWCAGAVLAPCLSTVLLQAVAPSLRLALFSPLFLVPLNGLGAGHWGAQNSRKEEARLDWRAGILKGALLCTIMFVVYGGIEASLSAWIPAFVVRYSAGRLAAAQWILSLFWLGLIAGRVAVAAFVTPQNERMLLRYAMGATAVCVGWLLAAGSLVQATVCSAAMGICIAPLFPLLLSSVLARQFSNRTMGIMLAGCALGSALLPFLLGILSNLFSLRVAMVLPIAGLLFLLMLQWESPQRRCDSR